MTEAANIPSFKEGQPRRSKNVTLPQRHRRGVGRSDNRVPCYDLPASPWLL